MGFELPTLQLKTKTPLALGQLDCQLSHVVNELVNVLVEIRQSILNVYEPQLEGVIYLECIKVW